jgi:hypothetical protein
MRPGPETGGERPGGFTAPAKYFSESTTVPGIGQMMPPLADQTLAEGSTAGAPVGSPSLDAPSAGSIERELSSLMTKTVEMPAHDPEAPAEPPSSKKGVTPPSSSKRDAVTTGPTAHGSGGHEPAAPPGERGESLDHMPPSMPTPRIDTFGGAVEALRAWLVPSPDGTRIVLWSPTRPLGAVEVVVLATQAGANLRSLLS